MTQHFERMNTQARRALDGADSRARELGHLTIEPLHLLRELLDLAEPLWSQLRTDRKDLGAFVDVRLARLPRRRGAIWPSPSPLLVSVLERARSEGAELVGPAQLLAALTQLSLSDDASELLREFGVHTPEVRAAAALVPSGEVDAPPVQSARADSTAPGPPRPAAPVQPETAPSSDPLTSFGVDLTALAASGQFDPIVGRAAEIRRLMQILTRRRKNNPVLLGEPGVGKRTIVHGLALRIVAGDVPANLRDRRLIALDPGILLAGARLRGELEQRIKAILDALRESAGQVILFAEELPALLGAGSSGGSAGAGELLRPALTRGEIRIIGRTTPLSYRQQVEADPSLARCFQTLLVDPPNEKEAAAILRGVVERYEIHHGVRISDPACLAAVRASQRYLPDRRLPDKAIDLIDEAAARLRLEIDSLPTSLDEVERRIQALRIEHESLHDDLDEASRNHAKEIEAQLSALQPRAAALRERWQQEKRDLDELRSIKARLDQSRREEQRERALGNSDRAAELRIQVIPQLEQQVEALQQSLERAPAPLVREAVIEADIAQVVSDWTGIPVTTMLADEAERLLEMERHLAERVVGQEEAVGLVARAVRRGRVGLRDPGRPIGSFLFLGPTGVGKTELAKALAQFVFDDEAAMTRLDMSEFMERHMVARLVGAPPGYADSEEGGYLTEAVRARPYSVVLLDEIEKAHRDVFDVLLQLLDDGRLTDGRGRTVDFTNTLIIMTSNLAGSRILAHEGDPLELRKLVETELHRELRPEFINRIDDIVIFQRLTREALAGIARLQLSRLSAMLAERTLTLQLSPAALELLVERGFDPAFGARPIRRLILKEIQDPLAELLLRRRFVAGDTVVVDRHEQRFTFSDSRS